MGLNYRIWHLLSHHRDLPDDMGMLNPDANRKTLHVLLQNVYGSSKSILSQLLKATFLQVCRSDKQKLLVERGSYWWSLLESWPTKQSKVAIML